MKIRSRYETELVEGRITTKPSDVAAAKVAFNSMFGGDINFSETQQGVHTAMIPLVIPIGGHTKTVLVTATVEAETTKNNRGMTRVMLKVSLPYLAYNPDAPSGTLPLKRDSGTMSMHMVLSVPRATVDDLRTGDNADGFATAQINCLRYLFRCLTQNLDGSSLVVLSPGTDSTIKRTVPIEPISDDTSISATDGKDVAQEPAFYSFQGGRVKAMVTTCYDQNSGKVGLYTDTTTLSADADDPLVRGLYGLRPIEESTILPAPTLVVPFDPSQA